LLEEYNINFGGNLESFEKIKSKLEKEIKIYKIELKDKDDEIKMLGVDTDSKLKEYRILKKQIENMSIEGEESKKELCILKDKLNNEIKLKEKAESNREKTKNDMNNLINE
jgi:hypothetical protein